MNKMLKWINIIFIPIIAFPLVCDDVLGFNQAWYWSLIQACGLISCGYNLAAI